MIAQARASNSPACAGSTGVGQPSFGGCESGRAELHLARLRPRPQQSGRGRLRCHAVCFLRRGLHRWDQEGPPS